MRLAARALVVVVLAASTVLLGGGRPSAPSLGAKAVRVDPAQFTTRIDNPFWPMRPGMRWVYRETDGAGDQRRIEVTVTARTRTVLGVQARVMREVVIEHGQLREVTDDWYAQDRQGNIWHLGEARHEHRDGQTTPAGGSWQAGVDGARPAIVLPADLAPGTVYRRDRAATQVLASGTKAMVPFGAFDHLVVTSESSPLQPKQVEHEFYARGVGPVLAVMVSGGSGREELVGFDRARTVDRARG